MTGDTIGRVSAEYRKKRVRRIKRMIITACVILILLPTVLSVFLMIKVFSLQNQLDKISENRRKTEQTSEMEVIQAKEKKTPEETEAPTKQTESPPEPTEVPPAEKKVYLTFEDGPGTQTAEILDVLKKSKIKATFFVTGKTDSYSKRIYKRIVKEGHTLGMHSYSHIYKEIYESTDSFSKDLEIIYKYLYKVTGVYPEFYRFPGGSSTNSTKIPIQNFIQILNQKKISYMDWNVISPDIGNPQITENQMVKKILQDVSQYDTSIVLMQDAADKPMTVKALPAVIKELKKENYKLLPIDRSTSPVRHNE